MVVVVVHIILLVVVAVVICAFGEGVDGTISAFGKGSMWSQFVEDMMVKFQSEIVDDRNLIGLKNRWQAGHNDVQGTSGFLVKVSRYLSIKVS